MITTAEMTMLRAADGNAPLPGIDTETGNQDSSTTLLQLNQLPILHGMPYYYNAALNTVTVLENGAVLNGINFGSATLDIRANNVTVENCSFTATSGWYSIDQEAGFSGATVKNCTFNSDCEALMNLAAFIGSTDNITIENNSFLNAPGDAVDIRGGTVTGNYFSGAGYSDLHPDAIWVTASTCPTLISDNFIDWTMNANSTEPTNDCIRITTELGSVSNVTVTGNYLIGGSAVIDAGNAGTDGTFSNVNITNNYIGFGVYSDFYPGPQTGVTKTGNVIVDFSNPIYSSEAWAAYQTSGIVTDSLVIATAGEITISAAATGTTTLYGGGLTGVHLSGKSSETIFIGGAGVQYMWGGSGQNIYTYLSVADSTVQASDSIGNFHVATDIIDLHAINANPASPTPVNLTFIGSAAFSGAGGEVRVIQDVADKQTLVEADLVGDSSADLEIRLSGLLNLTAANFALTNAQYQADIAPYTTMASFLTSQSSLDQVAGGYSIVDSLANIQPNLAALNADASNINAVTSTSGVIAVNAATFAADQTILNKFVGGFAVVDTGANIQAQIDALGNDSAAITSVTMSDTTASSPDVLSLSTAEAANDAAILAKITAPYVLDVVGASGATATGHGSGLTIDIGANGIGASAAPLTITGGAKGDAFYFSANFGTAQITDFASFEYNSSPDVISVSTQDFANWTTLVADGHAKGANTTFVAADGASLTVDGISLASFQRPSAALQSEFKFHA